MSEGMKRDANANAGTGQPNVPDAPNALNAPHAPRVSGRPS